MAEQDKGKFDPFLVGKWTGGKWISSPTGPLGRFVFDSRQVEGGDVFVALKTSSADGADYVLAAFEKGAAAAVMNGSSPRIAEAASKGAVLAVPDTLAALKDCARAYRRGIPFVVGITGSAGKSTTKEWLNAFLSSTKKCGCTIGNFNNEIGLPYSILASAPDIGAAVFEAGVSHPRDMDPLVAAMAPDAAVVTSIAPAHIEHFGSLDAIAEEKAKLLSCLPENGFAVLDARGSHFAYLSSKAPCRIVPVSVFGRGEKQIPGADYRAVLLSEGEGRFLLAGPGLERDVELSLGRAGRHMVLDALLALAAAREAGVPWEHIFARIVSLPQLENRAEEKTLGSVHWMVDAYNANPASMEASIKTFALSRSAGKRYFVLGDMLELGEMAESCHSEVSVLLSSLCDAGRDTLVCVGKLARRYASEPFAGRVLHAVDNFDAARLLRRELKGGEHVLLKASHSLRLDLVPQYFLSPLSLFGKNGRLRAVVLGKGKSGTAAASLLEGNGAEAMLLSGDDAFPADGADLVVASPGIPACHRWMEEAERRKIPVVPEIELGFMLWRGGVLAVTGSKGKSSAVKLLSEALALSGQKAVPCGNYGTPLSLLAMDAAMHGAWAVLEASSFQLETVRRFRPDISVFLDFQPDHLDRHGTMEAYLSAKMKIFRNFVPERDLAVLTKDVLRYGGEIPGKGLEYGDYLLYGNIPALRAPEIPEGSYFANPVLAGAVYAAGAALARAGTPPDILKEALDRFSPLPHRMQLVARHEGRNIEFIDNSKATSLSALAASLEMAGRPVRLVAGGILKESGLGSVKNVLAKYAKKVYLIGSGADLMHGAWQDAVPCMVCGGMESAVNAAYRECGAGECILLAPGCASFDQFGGYAERGDKFASCARELVAPEDGFVIEGGENNDSQKL